MLSLTDLKRTVQQVKADWSPSKPTKPEYPYGLEVRLEKEEIKKLGLNLADFPVGSKVTIDAISVVERISEDENSKTLTLQIQKMRVIPEKQEKKSNPARPNASKN